ncbi:MAG: hypothetical protein J6U70_02345 [Bacteroidales bacterium]|nr:hypothetical protein [Bacteroidales bacterium]
MKTKNLFISMLAVAGMLFATSCSQEMDAPQGDYVNATFTITTADAIGTRAIGDGKTVDKVACAVYDAEGIELDELYTVLNVENKTATYDVRLAKGQNYRLAFFAYNEAANAYDVADLKNVVVKDDQKSNVEGRDAFTAFKDIKTNNSAINETVTLTRPFAQLNLGVDAFELEDARKAGIVVERTKIVVSNVYKAFSAYDNDLVEGAAAGEMVFELNTIPTETLNVTVNGEEKEFTYLALNYLLAGAQTLTNVDFTWEGKDGETNDPVTSFLNVPVQRNFRTNIIGKLLTNPASFEIVVDADFDGEELVHTVFSAQDLQGVLDRNQAAGTHTFYLGANITGDVTILQREGVDIVIDGNNYEWNGGVTINGNARAKGAETLTLKNINFVADEAKTFIDAPTKIDGKYNYSHNVTVDNCTFSSEEYNEEIVGIKLLTTYNAVVKNCTATNIHTLAQFQSVDNATVIENVKVVNCKNGISLGNMASATITNAEISTKGYGVRLDGEKTREVAVTIENATIEAFIPVNVRKMNDDACKATVRFEGDNTLVGEVYEIAFCSNEYENGVDPVAPKGTFTLDGAEAFRAYFGPVNSVSAFDAAINSYDEEVIVESAITSVGTGFEVERDVVFDFQGEELNAGSTASSTWYALQIYGDNDVEINNANFTRAGVYADGANVVFNSGVINHNPERTSRYIFCARNGSTITINDGTFKNDRAKNSYFWADNSTIYVKGGNFGGVASNNKVVLSNGGQVIITGGTFNFDPTAWVAEGYAATKNGSTWTVAAI